MGRFLMLLACYVAVATAWADGWGSDLAGGIFHQEITEREEEFYSVSRTADGRIMVAGKRLKIWNGLSWQIIGGAEGAMAAYQDKSGVIWAAGSGRFYRIDQDESGSYRTFDLTESILRPREALSLVWKIFPVDDGVLIVAHSAVIFHNGVSAMSWSFQSEANRLLPFMSGNRPYIYSRGEGLYTFDGDLRKVLDEQPEFSSGFTGIMPHKTGWILSTLTDGFFTWDGREKVEPIFEDISPGDKENIIKLIGLQDGGFAYITLKDVYLISEDGLKIGKWNQPKGFILDIIQTEDYSLWVGSTVGLSRLRYPDLRLWETEDPIFIERAITLADLSTEQVILRHDEKGASFSFEGQDFQLKMQSNYGGFIISSVNQGYFYKPTSGRIDFFAARSDGFRKDGSIPMNFWPHTALELLDGSTIWSSNSGQAYLAPPPQEWGERPEFLNLSNFQGWPETREATAFAQINELQVVAIAAGKVYRLDQARQKFRPIIDLPIDHTSDSWSYRTAKKNDGSVVIAASSSDDVHQFFQLKITRAGEYSIKPIYVPGAIREMKLRAIRMVDYKEGTHLFVESFTESFIINIEAVPEPEPIAIQIRQLAQIDSGKIGKIENASARLTHVENNLRFYFARDFRSEADIQYIETRMVGIEDDWLDIGKSSYRDFSALPHGSFTFQARAVDFLGRAGPVASLELQILAPWWHTWWAYALFSAAGLSLLIAVVKLITRAKNAYLKTEVARLLSEQDAELSRKVELFDVVERVAGSWRVRDRAGFLKALSELDELREEAVRDLPEADPLATIVRQLNSIEKERSLTDQEINYRSLALTEMHSRSQRAERLGWDLINEQEKRD